MVSVSKQRSETDEARDRGIHLSG
uniref:Uncharacterized protein n=1 Tax=Anguilla anguilla TaxID=7936 RepID=A0A0E9SZT0_ANGAN